MAQQPPEDWQCGKSLTECNSYAFNQQIACDVTFQVKDSLGKCKFIGAHRYPLSIRSPVFFAMFHGGLAEGTSEISIDDIEERIVREMLKYFKKITNCMAILYILPHPMVLFADEDNACSSIT